MFGKIKSVITRIKEVAPKISNSHCVLHRHALATKKLSTDLKSALDVAVQCVNFIKSRSLKTRLFKKLCEKMGSDQQNLLLHTEIRWLFRGKVLIRLYELRDEVKNFLKEHTKRNLFEWFHDVDWLIKLAQQIFSTSLKLDKTWVTNLGLQGKKTSIFQANDKSKALISKSYYLIEQ
ncbi:unnamed protein product [Macrosiphum euphorbiae]|uniref:Zinc finger BED domain-containing protein 5 n=1 Tax=Macrosiphum euphorbiae TaxID=13131 RepID=A0AAV0XXD7_9HEMI|nr:unnamed protein product [Macrosiphum euphorbiae]